VCVCLFDSYAALLHVWRYATSFCYPPCPTRHFQPGLACFGLFKSDSVTCKATTPMQIEIKRDAGALVWVQSLQLSAALPADGAPYHDEQLTRKLPPSGQPAAPPSTLCGTGRVWTRLYISATTWSSNLNHGYLLPMFKVSRWVIDQSKFNAALPKSIIC
jgi:hypothetical protein